MKENIKNIKNNAYMLLDLFMKDEKFETYSQLAQFLGITQSAINGWLERNSVRTIQKHLLSKGVDIQNLIDRIENSEKKEKNLLDTETSSNVENEKGKFFLACEKYKITLEDIAQQTNISVEKIKIFKNDETTTQIFGDYDDFLAKCFYEKYNELMRSQVRTTEAKRTQFAELYFVNIYFPKPLFWLIYICIGFYVAEGKIKPEEVENFLDILIENRQNFGSEISSIQSTEELIDTVLIKIEELLPKTDKNEVEEFVSLFSKPSSSSNNDLI